MKEKLVITIDLQISSANSDFNAVNTKPYKLVLTGKDYLLSNIADSIYHHIRNISRGAEIECDD